MDKRNKGLRRIEEMGLELEQVQYFLLGCPRLGSATQPEDRDLPKLANLNTKDPCRRVVLLMRAKKRNINSFNRRL